MEKLGKLIFIWGLCALSLSCSHTNVGDPGQEADRSRRDDWQFNYQEDSRDSNPAGIPTALGSVIGTTLMSRNTTQSLTQSAAPAALGFAVGGAKDADNFLHNLESGYLPKYDSITYEGLFYDYYFDTGAEAGTCDTLFCPAFTSAVTTDLYSKKAELLPERWPLFRINRGELSAKKTQPCGRAGHIRVDAQSVQ